jgi:hypothetical protein
VPARATFQTLCKREDRQQYARVDGHENTDAHQERRHIASLPQLEVCPEAQGYPQCNMGTRQPSEMAAHL